MDPNAAPGRRRNWTRIALIVSLGVNLAVVGLVSGLMVKGPPHGRGADAGLWRYGDALPDPYRRDLVRTLREGRGDWEDRRSALRDQRRALAAALTAEPYDPAAIERVLRAEGALLSSLADRGTGLLLAQIERMSPEQRRDYAEALLSRREEPRGRRR